MSFVQALRIIDASCKIKSMREEPEYDTEIERDPLTGLIEGEYDRPADEYVRPTRVLELQRLPIDDWFNAAGAELHADRLPPVGSKAFGVELVPEPGNPWHSRAVCVEKRGVRVGYMPARLANLLHRHIRYLNDAGLEVTTTARVTDGNEWSQNVFALEVDFPRYLLHDIFVEWTGMYGFNKTAIACMPREEQESFSLFVQYGYSEYRDPPSDEAIECFFAVRRKLTGNLSDGLVTRDDIELVKDSWGSHSTLRAAVGTEGNRNVRVEAAVRLVRKRLAARLVEAGAKKVDAARALEVSPSTVARYMKEIEGKEKLPSDQERKIAPTERVSEAELQQAQDAISASLQDNDWINRDFPLHARSFEATSYGAVTYGEACEYASLLSSFDYQEDEIASVLKCPASLVPQLVNDLEFYQNPAKNKLRHERVLQLRKMLESPNPTFHELEGHLLEMALIDQESLLLLELRAERHPIFSIVRRADKMLDEIHGKRSVETSS